MQSRLRLAGHGVQPLLLMFPLGLFAMALIFDQASLLGAPRMIGTLAFWNIAAGLAGGLFAALAGGFDAFTNRDPVAARSATLRLLFDVGVLIFFAVITLTRVRGQDRMAEGGLLTVEVLGFAVAAFGAWFGGRFTGQPVPRSGRRPGWWPATSEPPRR